MFWLYTGCETPKHSPHMYLVGENINITITIKGEITLTF